MHFFFSPRTKNLDGILWCQNISRYHISNGLKRNSRQLVKKFYRFESFAAPKERSPYGGREIRHNSLTDKGLSLDVRVGPDKDTVWLAQTEMAELFDAKRKAFFITFGIFISKENWIKEQLVKKFYRFKPKPAGWFDDPSRFTISMSSSPWAIA